MVDGRKKICREQRVNDIENQAERKKGFSTKNPPWKHNRRRAFTRERIQNANNRHGTMNKGKKQIRGRYW